MIGQSFTGSCREANKMFGEQKTELRLDLR